MDTVINRVLPNDYRKLVFKVTGEKIKEVKAIDIMRNSALTVGLYEDGELMAFGRVCGDRAMYYLVCDVFIDENAPYLGLAEIVIKEIDDYLKAVSDRHSKAIVMSDPRYDRLWRSLGFKYIDSDYRSILER